MREGEIVSKEEPQAKQKRKEEDVVMLKNVRL